MTAHPKRSTETFTTADLQALADRLSLAGSKAPRIVADRDLRRDERLGAAAIRVLLSRIDTLAAAAGEPALHLSPGVFEIDEDAS